MFGVSPIIAVLEAAVLYTITLMNGKPHVLYNSPDIDITEHVLAYLMAHREPQLLSTK